MGVGSCLHAVVAAVDQVLVRLDRVREWRRAFRLHDRAGEAVNLARNHLGADGYGGVEFSDDVFVSAQTAIRLSSVNGLLPNSSAPSEVLRAAAPVAKSAALGEIAGCSEYGMPSP